MRREDKERLKKGELEVPKPEEASPKPDKRSAFDTRNFYRKQAGWPLLKESKQ